MNTTPTDAALRAARAIFREQIEDDGMLSEERLAHIIDRETELPDLLELARRSCQDYWKWRPINESK